MPHLCLVRVARLVRAAPPPGTNERTTMPSIAADNAAFEVTGGVDTHQDTHTAAVTDQVGRVLGTQQFPATTAGYTALLAWIREFGQLLRSVSRGPAPTAQGWPGGCVANTSR